MSEYINGTAKQLGYETIKGLVGKTVHLEFNEDPNFHINIEIPADLREATASEWMSEGSVAIMPSRKREWPDKIYESTVIVYPPEIV